MSLWSGGATSSKSLKSIFIPTSGEWVVPVGADPIVKIDGCGGGSGGGGALTGGGGGGGGAGSQACEQAPFMVSPGETLTITIGAGGTAGASGAVPTAGGVGGSTFILGLLDILGINAIGASSAQTGGGISTANNGGAGGAGSRSVHPEGLNAAGGAAGVAAGSGGSGVQTASFDRAGGAWYGGGSGSGGAGKNGRNSFILGGGVFNKTGAQNPDTVGNLGRGGIPGASRWGKVSPAAFRFIGPLPYPALLAGDRVTNFGYGMGGEGATAGGPSPTAGEGLPGFIRIWYME